MNTRPLLRNGVHCFMTVGQQWMDYSCIYSRLGIQRYRSNFTMAGHTTIMSLLYFVFVLMEQFELLSLMFQFLSMTARLRS
jgi:hypothetical protein